MRVNFNECKYSCNADKPHDTCTHQNYCVFNENRTELESRITELENELEDVENQLIQYPYIYTVMSHSELIKEKTLLINDLEELRNLRNYIIDKEVKGYGYRILES